MAGPALVLDTQLELPVDGPFDLLNTLRPLVRGYGDRTIRISPRRAIWVTRTMDGPATLRLDLVGERIVAEAFGPGADVVLSRAGRLVGIAPGMTGVRDLVGHADPRIDRLARRLAGVRLTRTESVLDALVPAILEQKVTGFEARRAWQGLVRAYGEPAPGPPALVAGLRVAPDPRVLAALPYYAYHRFGVEQRRADVIRRVAAVAERLERIVDLPLPEAESRLRAIPGIGPWTAAEVTVRALGDPDAVSVGDFHLPGLVVYALSGESDGDDARMLELLEPYHGQRALVVRCLELGGSLRGRRAPRMSPRDISTI
jgi:3-methyladenine DNA glycosylase/8-oxoguanine DNA glycosylase